jgi:hypothetical protein
VLRWGSVLRAVAVGQDVVCKKTRCALACASSATREDELKRSSEMA